MIRKSLRLRLLRAKRIDLILIIIISQYSRLSQFLINKKAAKIMYVKKIKKMFQGKSGLKFDAVCFIS